MSVLNQAREVAENSDHRQKIMVLHDATAILDDIPWGHGHVHKLAVCGRDESGVSIYASIPFQPHYRAEAAVVMDEIERTGIAVVKSHAPDGFIQFEADSIESGDAVVDRSHNRFDLMRVISHGIGIIRGKTQDDVEEMAVASHRLKSHHDR